MPNHEAYCDESTGTHEHEARFYVVAGYLAPTAEWRHFESAWRNALVGEGLTSFHQTDCDRGYGEFAHLHGMDYAAERERIQRRFIGIIKNHRIFGVSTAIVLPQFRKFASKLEVLLERQYNTPYMHAFRTTLHTMADQLRSFPADEKIAFTFDRHPQYSGRSEALFRSIAAMDASKFVWRGRLESFARASRVESAPLQAADILSYETFRHAERRDTFGERWQRAMLFEGGQVLSRTMGRRFFQRLIFNMNNR